MNSNPFTSLATAEGVWVLNATGIGRSSWEDQHFKHGRFTQYVLEGLAGRAVDPATGLVTLETLMRYVRSNVYDHTHQFHPAEVQIVTQQTNGSGDVYLAGALKASRSLRAVTLGIDTKAPTGVRNGAVQHANPGNTLGFCRRKAPDISCG
jgi:hypothetical protein